MVTAPSAWPVPVPSSRSATQLELWAWLSANDCSPPVEVKFPGEKNHCIAEGALPCAAATHPHWGSTDVPPRSRMATTLNQYWPAAPTTKGVGRSTS
jgi:hypothetical protein